MQKKLNLFSLPKKKRKVAIISATFENIKPGGGNTYAKNRAIYLSKRFNVAHFSLSNSYSREYDKYDIKNIGLGNYLDFKYKFLIFWIRLLVDLIKFRPQFIEVNNFPIAIPILLFFRYHIVFHGPYKLESRVEKDNILKRKIGVIIEILFLRFSKKIFTVSKTFNELIKKEYNLPNKKLLIKKPKMEFPKLNKQITLKRDLKLQDNKRKLKLIAIRRLVRRTGINDLVNAYCYCLKNNLLNYESSLTIIGSGPEYELIQNNIKSQKMSSKIKVLQNLSNKKRDDLISQSDWNICPTIALEGFGLVVIESAIFGVPSLVTNIDNLPHIVKELDSIGKICEPGLLGLVNGLIQLYPYKKETSQRLKEITLKKYFFKI